MRLSDIMAAAGLSSWAEIGLVLSFVTFAAIAVYVLLPRAHRGWDRARLLPLAEDHGQEAITPSEEVEL